MRADTTAGIGPPAGRGTAGMADVEEHRVKAATYGVVCARRADDLLRRDTWTMNVVLGVASVTSLGAFTAVSRNPALWAQLLVAVLAGTAAVLTAIRQQNDWARQSGTLRARGVGWNRQCSFAGDLAQRLHDGGTITEKERTRLDDDESRLLDGHPWISTEVYNDVEPDKRSEFRDSYERA